VKVTRALFAASIFFLIISGYPLFSESAEHPRIVVCGRGFSLVADALYMFPEASEAVVAMGNTNQAGGSFQSYLDPDSSSRAVISMDAGAEEIASYRPDWVILKSYLMGSLGSSLEKLGISVLYVDLETPEQYERDLTAIGRILGNPERASELIEYFKRGREDIIRRVNFMTDREKPSVLFLYYTTRGGSVSFSVPPAEWLQSLLLDWAGSRPVWTGSALGRGWTSVNFEQVAAWNPEYILVTAYHNDVDKVKAVLTSDSKWKLLSSVKSGRLLAFPGDYLSWDQPDPRWILGLNWITSVLHPGIISEDDLYKEIYHFFDFLYGLPEERVKNDILPVIKGDLIIKDLNNGDAAN
jgi:iron complex transport system substrate-binding protein